MLIVKKYHIMHVLFLWKFHAHSLQQNSDPAKINMDKTILAKISCYICCISDHGCLLDSMINKADLTILLMT